MKNYLLILLLIISSPLFGQKNSIEGIKLKKAKIKSFEKDSTSFGDLTFQANKYIVKSKTRVTTRASFTGLNNKYKMANIKVAIYQLPDSNCRIKDSIYSHMKSYWVEQEKWMRNCPGYKDSINLKGNFCALPINEGFVYCGNDTVPFINPGHGRIGTYEIFHFKGNFYKIVLVKSFGLGGMGFLGQNMVFVHDEKEYPFNGPVSCWMDEIREILKMKKNCG